MIKKIINIKKKILSKDYINIYVILIFIFTTRFFIIEPFRIPSGSMQPTILIGDFIFVNKFIYGIKIPLINKKIKINTPEKGDIIVFKKNDGKNYIKRIIAVSNDNLIYENKQVYLNHRYIKKKYKGKKIDFDINSFLLEINYYKEYLTPKKEYYIQIYKNINHNEYKFSNIKIPQNSYFVLGDNRDNSEDSRFWGYVAKDSIIGKALLIWISIDVEIMDIRWERFFKLIK